MTQLFYQLIYHEKTVRWLFILECLEELATFTAHELALRLKCTEKTIGSDIKEIKRYFGSTIVLFGDKEGYHFSLNDPVGYIKNKQALLDKEPLFNLIDQLIEGKERTNQQWANQLSVSISSFGRIKKKLVTLLNSRYQLILVNRNNQLHGEETSIRQLMYDFYFESPLLPSRLGKERHQLLSTNQLEASGQWQLDPIRLKQWTQIASWRIKQGHNLSYESDQKQQKKLVDALDEAIVLPFPQAEKAALFLLALKEEQFLNPLHQKEFIHQFSVTKGSVYSTRDFDQMTAQFFELMVTLVNQFFQLSTDDQRNSEALSERAFLKQIIDKYLDQKKRIEKSLILHFNLTGSRALQEWIQKNVRYQLENLGYYVIENSQGVPYARQLIISNKLTEETFSDIKFSLVPEEKEILQEIQKKIF